jgi:hypothetical protein
MNCASLATKSLEISFCIPHMRKATALFVIRHTPAIGLISFWRPLKTYAWDVMFALV